MTRIQQQLTAYSDARRTVLMLQGQLKCMSAAPDTPTDMLNAAKNRLTLAQSQCQAAKKLTQQLINQVPETLNMREILSMRYLNLMRWDDISACMYLTKRWVMRLHKRALDFLATHK